jgi:hypothetical protein
MLVFDPGRPFQPSLMVVGKARSLPKSGEGAPGRSPKSLYYKTYYSSNFYPIVASLQFNQEF